MLSQFYSHALRFWISVYLIMLFFISTPLRNSSEQPAIESHRVMYKSVYSFFPSSSNTVQAPILHFHLFNVTLQQSLFLISYFFTLFCDLCDVLSLQQVFFFSFSAQLPVFFLLCSFLFVSYPQNNYLHPLFICASFPYTTHHNHRYSAYSESDVACLLLS